MNSFVEFIPVWLADPSLLLWGEVVLGLLWLVFVLQVLGAVVVKPNKASEIRYRVWTAFAFLGCFISALPYAHAVGQAESLTCPSADELRSELTNRKINCYDC